MSFPDNLDTFVDPSAGDPLASSNGRSSTQMVSDLNTAMEQVELITVGPVFANASAYTELTELVLNSGDSVSDGTGTWTEVGHIATGTPVSTTVDPNPLIAVDTAMKTTGTGSITARINAPNLNTTNRISVDLPAPVSTAGRRTLSVDIAVDAMGASTVGGAGWEQYGLVVADGTALSGNRVVFEFEGGTFLTERSFETISIDINTLTTIRSVGVQKIETAGSSSHNGRFWLDNVRLRAATGIDQALISKDTVNVVIPADYTSIATQQSVDPGSSTFLDLRQGEQLGGARHVKEWLVDDTGTEDVGPRLLEIMNTMPPGSKLLFTPGGRYRCESSFSVTDLEDVVFDGQGAAFFSTMERGSGFCGLTGCNNVTFRNFRIFGTNEIIGLGSTFLNRVGSPAIVGTTKVLSISGQAVSFESGQNIGRDPDGMCNIMFTLSDTAHTANDCSISFVSYQDQTVLATTTIPALTDTPTEYTISVAPQNLGDPLIPVVTKLTSAVNSITVTQGRNTQAVAYDANIEGAFGFGFGVGNVGCTIENFSVEGVSGDGFQCSQPGNRDNTIRNFFIRATGRQGFSVNFGDNFLVENFVVREGRRHGFDIEPYTVDWHVADLTVRNGYLWNQELGSMLVQHASRCSNVNITNVITGGDSQGDGAPADILFESDGGTLNNIQQQPVVLSGTSGEVHPGLIIGGRNVHVYDSTFQYGILCQASDTSFTYGGHHLQDIRIANPSTFGYLSIEDGCVNCVVDSVVASTWDQVIQPGALGVVGQGAAPWMLTADTIFTGLDAGPVQETYPNTYKGRASSPIWFPGGQNHLGEPDFRVRSISGTTTRANNLRGLAAAVTAGSTTATVAFPVQGYSVTFGNPSINPAVDATSTLAPSTTYFYRVAALPPTGGPGAPNVQLSRATGTTSLALDISMGLHFANASTGTNVWGVRVYRGTVTGGPYTTYYDWRPSTYMPGSAGAHTLRDLGSTLKMQTAGYTGTGQFGYPSTVPAVTGSFTPVDESGYEPDTSYGVWVMPSWPTTVAITAKRTNGFDVQFGVACPTGGGTFDWMIIR